MNEQPVGTLTHGDYKAEIFSLSLPGEFRIEYRDSSGQTIEEDVLAGISSYKQRENEIVERLHELAHGSPPRKIPDLGDSGEYS